MRKFIAAGLGSVTLAASAFTMAFAAPAQAAPLIPGICESVPTLVASATGALGVANSALGVAQDAEETKRTALTDALSAYVEAAVDYVQAVDAGTALNVVKGILDARIADVGAKAADWSNSRVALWNAENSQFASQINLDAIQQAAGLLCV